MMKKIVNYITLMLFVSVTFIPIIIVKAETLKDVKDNLAKIQSQKAESDALTQEAENNIKAKANAIKSANNTISENEDKVEDSKQLVTASEEQIKEKTEALKDVIDVIQYSEINDKEIYVDYIFAAENITDLMERQEIVEQIANYTQEELNKLEALIKENKALQVKLADDNVALESSITNYEKQIEELQAYVDKQINVGMGYADQIKAQQSLIKIYENAGCKDGDDIDACYYSKMGGSGAFSRPLTRGKVTQPWNATHGGIDLGGNKEGTPVYAPANGTVIYVAYKTTCGGNIVYMHSLVDGKKYTVEMAHLLSVSVSSGQVLTKGQQIGTVGGSSTSYALSGGYDRCSFGAHLHYAISYGYHFKQSGRVGWNEFKTNTKATAVESITSIKSTRGWTWNAR